MYTTVCCVTVHKANIVIYDREPEVPWLVDVLHVRTQPDQLVRVRVFKTKRNLAHLCLKLLTLGAFIT